MDGRGVEAFPLYTAEESSARLRLSGSVNLDDSFDFSRGELDEI
jgi:hypothetical protein